MRNRNILGYLALVLAALTAAGLLWYVYFVPYTLRVAVGPSNTEPTELLAAMSAAIEHDNASVRLVLIPYANLADTSAALDARQADLAVVRTDLSLPTSGLGVAIVHQYMALTLSRPQANIKRFTDLRNHSVGVVSPGTGNTTLFETLLSSYELKSGNVRVVPLTSPDEIPAAVASGRIDAVFVAGPRGGRLITKSFHAFSGAIKGAPVFVPISEAAALVARNPVFAAGEIAPGELEIKPLMPPKEIQTLTFPLLLVASNRLAPKAVQEFTKQLFSLRHALLAQNPEAGRIEKLSTDRGESFAVHPGAATYYDAEETSLLSGLSDWFWVGMLGLGGIGSMGAWILSRLFPRRREMVQAEFTELLELMEKARAATSTAEVENIEREIDKLVTVTSQLLFDGSIDDIHQPAFDLILARIETVLEAKRQELGSQS
jgi:ABC-type nitrate/sulfonate/bicarbonate transport system substrate-binding protein